MNRLTAGVTRIIIAAVVLAIVVGAGLFLMLGGSDSKKVSAYFSSGVGVYRGTPVKILGVEVGRVTKVTPHGDSVRIEMSYDSKYKLPANAVSLVVANSLVSERYLQLAPVYSGSGPTMPDGGEIPLDRTASPAELDDIYSALNQLSVALGPQGANKTGALTTFLKVAAANLKGNGADFGASITQLSKAARTLATGREDLFGTVRNLQTFTEALAASDKQVRHFEEQLAQVAGDLADERADLGAALKNLTSALHDVANFVNTHADKIHTDVVGLKDVTGVLVKQKGALDEILAVGPVALANIVHVYQEDLGVLPTRSNLASITDPKNLCTLLTAGGLLTDQVLGGLVTEVTKTCKSVLGSGGLQLPSGLNPSALNSLLTSLLNGGGGLIGATG